MVLFEKRRKISLALTSVILPAVIHQLNATSKGLDHLQVTKWNPQEAEVTVIVTELPNLIPPRSTCLSLDTKYLREDTKSRGSVEHTLRENPKIHIFPSGSQMRE